MIGKFQRNSPNCRKSIIRKHNLGRMSWPSNHVPPSRSPNFINLMSRRRDCSRNKSEVQRANGRDFHESLHNLIDYLHVLRLRRSVLFRFPSSVCVSTSGWLSFLSEPEKKVKKQRSRSNKKVAQNVICRGTVILQIPPTFFAPREGDFITLRGIGCSRPN